MRQGKTQRMLEAIGLVETSRLFSD